MTGLIFHGGHYKTGTTSLQHALRTGEGLLAGAGILYPRGLPVGVVLTAQTFGRFVPCTDGGARADGGGVRDAMDDRAARRAIGIQPVVYD